MIKSFKKNQISRLCKLLSHPSPMQNLIESTLAPNELKNNNISRCGPYDLKSLPLSSRIIALTIWLLSSFFCLFSLNGVLWSGLFIFSITFHVFSLLLCSVFCKTLVFPVFLLSCLNLLHPFDFPSSHLPITERGLLKSPPSLVELFLSPFDSVHICFM